MTNAPLIARTLLRLLAFVLVASGQFAEDQVSFIYQNADLAAAASLAVSETWLAWEKWRKRNV